MTNKKQALSYNTNKHQLLVDDWDNSTNNGVYPVSKFSKWKNSVFVFIEIILHFLKS
jgi:hypothetical protein